MIISALCLCYSHKLVIKGWTNNKDNIIIGLSHSKISSSLYTDLRSRVALVAHSLAEGYAIR